MFGAVVNTYATLVCAYGVCRHTCEQERLHSVSYVLEHMQVVHFEGDSWELSYSEVQIADKLGEGNYGDVFRGQLAMTAMSPRIYAHKRAMEFEGKSHLTVAVKMLRRK